MKRKLLAAMVLTLAATAAQAQGPEKSLYERLGKADGINAVISQSLAEMAIDRRINARLARMDVNATKAMMAGRLCKLEAGQCKSEGVEPIPAKPPVTMLAADWSFWLEDVGKALDRFKVQDKERAEFLAAMAPLKPLVVLP